MPDEAYRRAYYQAHKAKWREYAKRRKENAPRCAVEDLCDGPAVAFGFCVKHYKRWRKSGVLHVANPFPRSSSQRNREYYLAHRDERIAYQTTRRNRDPEAARAYERAVYQRRRVKAQAANRARERRMEPLDRDSLEYEQVLRADPCSYCGAAATQIDHIEPVSVGGRNHWTNLTPACQPCNRAKSADPLLVFLSGI